MAGLATIEALCTPVPVAPERCCAVCHGYMPSRWRPPVCSGCRLVMARLPRPAGLVVPISMYSVGGGLHRVLRGYKDAARASIRTPSARLLAELLGSFLDVHGACLGGADPVVVVPSSTGRPGRHPLEEVARAAGCAVVTGLGPVAAPAGGTTLGHRRPSATVWTATADVVGTRVLVVDDTWTSGARAQSAASALAAGGAEVTAVLAIGRVADPGFSREAGADWGQWRGRDFSMATCCLRTRWAA